MKRNNRKLRGVGTCAITAVLFKGYIIVANSGDSQAMLISQK
jgi:serine/threonine protein phosphatase PrpC